MQSQRKLVLADYFLGFATRPISGGARPWRLYYESEEDATRKVPHCNAAFSGDLYLNRDIKEIASTYYPAIGPYDATDPDVVEYHVLLAKAAGIDGFMAEFTMGQEDQLLNLVRAAQRHGLQVGVNWISQSHFRENTWRDRDQAIARAHELVRWMVRHVYQPCGVRLGERYLFLIFLAHPREGRGLNDSFFSPHEVQQLKAVAADEGCDADFFVLPWEPLPVAAGEAVAGAVDGVAARVWDGYFPWVWSSSGSPADVNSAWSHVTTRAHYIQRLAHYYATADQLKRQGRIGSYIGAVCPGFDDHKGQAWGESLKRQLPRDGGLTFQATWDELARSGVNAALVVTWNDWIESSQLEPSLELGYADLIACAKQIANWRGGQPPGEPLLRLPQRLFAARKDLHQLVSAGAAIKQTSAVCRMLDSVAFAIANEHVSEALDQLASVRQQIDGLRATLHQLDVHVFWEFGFDHVGLAQVSGSAPVRTVEANRRMGIRISEAASEVGFAIADDALRGMLQRGIFVGRLCVEYLDSGTDYVRVLVDALDEQHRVIASFKKGGSDQWRGASLDLVNAQFDRGLPGGADLSISQLPKTYGGVRMVRLDGAVYFP